MNFLYRLRQLQHFDTIRQSQATGIAAPAVNPFVSIDLIKSIKKEL